MTSICTEQEVQNRVEHRGGVDGPLHHSYVGFSKDQEFTDGEKLSILPVGEGVEDVEQLKGCAGGLKEENEEQRNDGEPKIVPPEFPGAAGSRLDQQGTPWDKQENHGNHKGQDEGREVEEQRSVFILSSSVHAHHGIFRPSCNNIPVGILLPGAELGVEHRGNGEHGGEKPDERNVEGVRPGSGNVFRKVPLAVFSKQVVGEEERGQREEKQETVVEISKTKNGKI